MTGAPVRSNNRLPRAKFEQVAKWLKEGGLERYCVHFSAKGVDEARFRSLLMQDYGRYGVQSMEDKQKLFRLIKSVNSNSEPNGDYGNQASKDIRFDKQPSSFDTYLSNDLQRGIFDVHAIEDTGLLSDHSFSEPIFNISPISSISPIASRTRSRTSQETSSKATHQHSISLSENHTGSHPSSRHSSQRSSQSNSPTRENERSRTLFFDDSIPDLLDADSTAPSKPSNASTHTQIDPINYSEQNGCLSSETQTTASGLAKIKVVVRKRPLNKKEIGKKEEDVITIDRDTCSLVVHEPKVKVDLTAYTEFHEFCFDAVLDEKVSNDEVYHQTVKPIVPTIFQKTKATCFAYGQTGSGKTYTMQPLPLRAAQDMLAYIHSPEYSSSKYHLWISFFEIYGGKVFDLLNDRKKLPIREDHGKQVCIVGLKEFRVNRVEEVREYIEIGSRARSTGSTGANEESSRSHAIIQLVVKQKKETERKGIHQRRSLMMDHDKQSPEIVIGKFSFIDLAGSERGADTTDNDKQTRMEGAEINKSLLALKECIRALDHDQVHIPFRGSKLTEVLRDSFMGNSLTVMISCISPGSASVEHTINTLRYADRVKGLSKGGNSKGNTPAALSQREINLPSLPPLAPLYETLDESRSKSIHKSELSFSSISSYGIKSLERDAELSIGDGNYVNYGSKKHENRKSNARLGNNVRSGTGSSSDSRSTDNERSRIAKSDFSSTSTSGLAPLSYQNSSFSSQSFSYPSSRPSSAMSLGGMFSPSESNSPRPQFETSNAGFTEGVGKTQHKADSLDELEEHSLVTDVPMQRRSHASTDMATQYISDFQPSPRYDPSRMPDTDASDMEGRDQERSLMQIRNEMNHMTYQQTSLNGVDDQMEHASNSFKSSNLELDSGQESIKPFKRSKPPRLAVMPSPTFSEKDPNVVFDSLIESHKKLIQETEISVQKESDLLCDMMDGIVPIERYAAKMSLILAKRASKISEIQTLIAQFQHLNH